MTLVNHHNLVLIVGAGPTGLVLALWLSRQGIKVRLIDKSVQAGQASRAIAVQARTMEFYSQLGIIDEILNHGIKMENITLRKEGVPITQVNFNNIGDNLSPFPFVLSLPQDEHEKILIKQLKMLHVEVEREIELVSLLQTPDGVITQLRNLATGEVETVEAAYLCGCDGAKSTVRHLLNIEFPGGTYQQIFYVADVLTNSAHASDIQVNVSKKDFCLSFPIRTTTSIRVIGIVPEKYNSNDKIEFNDVKSDIYRNTQLEISACNWFSTYHVHHRVASQFNCERVFLLGDAAHIHSPAGGQGMNTGIGDSINLAWKLAGVLSNQLQKRILDTYEQERQQFAKNLVRTTDQVFQVATSTAWPGWLWRNIVFPYVMPYMFQRKWSSRILFKLISQISIHYRQSRLTAKSDGEVQAGDRLPWIADSNNYKPLSYLNWQIHIYGSITEAQKKIIKSLYPIFEFTWTNEMQRKGLIKNTAYLIRPDGYISVIDSSNNLSDILTMKCQISTGSPPC